jgi:hypothetical protein
VAQFSGNPAPGTGGQYQVQLASDAGGNLKGSQTLTLNINEAPKITSAGTATFIAGTPGSFAVTTTGFPSNSTVSIPPNPLPPTNPADGKGMYFTVSGLPAGLTARNRNDQGFVGGTLTIQGTPADAGTYPLVITAENGVGTKAQQTLTLNVVKITAPAPLSGSTCNGNYNGTFQGTLTVSAGQNCAFLGGGIQGNVSVQGGSLALNGAKVTGNVSVQGTTSFAFGPGTKIEGNLSINSISSGVLLNQICGTAVAGQLTVSQNMTPLALGDPQIPCLGNSFAGNASLTNNASVKLFGNSVSKNLSCSGNTTIQGGGNAAQKKQANAPPSSLRIAIA